MISFRRFCYMLSATLLFCVLGACQPVPKQLTFQVVDIAGNPLPNIQVDYGISRPETTENIGFTNEKGLLIWNDPPTGEQHIYIWKKDTPNGEPDLQYIPLKIRRADFGTTITLQAEWEAGESSSGTSSTQSTTK